MTAEALDLDALEGVEAFLNEMDRVDALNRGGAHYGDAVYGLNDLELKRSDIRALIARVRAAEAALADAWDEGCKFGYDYGRIEGRDDCAYAVPTANPYREGSTT